ncbi:MAG: hypothetical protein ACHQ4G_11055 [Opitutales bacterium]
MTARAQSEAPPDGWEFLARFLYRDAADAFRADRAMDPRLRDLGLAASLLNEPPVTSGKINQAESLLRGLIAQGPADSTTLYARYLLARVLHQHRSAPIEEVEVAYRAVIASSPASPVAQVAASHLALLLFYQRTDLPVDARLREAQALEPVAAARALPEVACGYYRDLANAAMFYGVLNPEVLHWLKQAQAVGSGDEITQTTLTLQVAETARALGQRDTALAYYRRYLATAVPTDQRYHTVEVRMRELEESAR